MYRIFLLDCAQKNLEEKAGVINNYMKEHL